MWTVQLTLELINSVWYILEIGLVIALASYLMTTFKNANLSLDDYIHFRSIPVHIQLVVAILTFHAGDLGIRFLVWYWRYLISRHMMVPEWISGFSLVFFAVIAVVGLLCLLRIVTTPRRGNWPWIVMLIIALVVTGYMSYDKFLF